MWHPGVWVEVVGASLPRVISSHQHLVFGPEQVNATRREIPLQPPSRVRQGTPPIHIIQVVFFSGVTFLGSTWEEEPKNSSRTPKHPPEVLSGCRPLTVHHSPAPSCSPSSGNLSILKTESCFHSTLYCLHFLYTLPTPQALKPQTLEVKSSPLCPNTSLPRNSGQKDRRPEGEEDMGEGKARHAGKKQYFKTQIPPCL